MLKSVLPRVGREVTWFSNPQTHPSPRGPFECLLSMSANQICHVCQSSQRTKTSTKTSRLVLTKRIAASGDENVFVSFWTQVSQTRKWTSLVYTLAVRLRNNPNIRFVWEKRLCSLTLKYEFQSVLRARSRVCLRLWLVLCKTPKM